jgi:hypothetical protein
MLQLCQLTELQRAKATRDAFGVAQMMEKEKIFSAPCAMTRFPWNRDEKGTNQIMKFRARVFPDAIFNREGCALSRRAIA